MPSLRGLIALGEKTLDWLEPIAVAIVCLFLFILDGDDNIAYTERVAQKVHWTVNVKFTEDFVQRIVILGYGSLIPFFVSAVC